MTTNCLQDGTIFWECAYHLCYYPGNWACIADNCNNQVENCEADILCNQDLVQSWNCNSKDYDCQLKAFSGSQNNQTKDMYNCINNDCANNTIQDSIFLGTSREVLA
mmetsp:Transcript_24606/g.21787  ORF Transcript_24606/g.21787 Transcript_24606/m.21787 type:complete len:107 (+) Transcript_24606:240-560(+)